jgi:hypothetical protein
VDDFSALAETRLIEGLERLFYNYTHNQDVSSLFAELFKMYVVGNEPEDPRQPEYLAKYAEYLPRMKDDKQISDFLEAYNVTFEELTEMVHSMLEDRSHYGDPERECREDDLNTTIPVRGDGWSAIVSAKWNEESDLKNGGWYTLQGVRVSKPSRKGLYIHNGRLSVVK